MNKLGVHALVWTGGWSHDEAARAIGSSAELGFDIIGACCGSTPTHIAAMREALNA